MKFTYNDFILTPAEKKFIKTQVLRFGITSLYPLIEAVKNDPELSQDEKTLLESCFTEFKERTGLKLFDILQLTNWIKSQPENRLSEKNNFIKVDLH